MNSQQSSWGVGQNLVGDEIVLHAINTASVTAQAAEKGGTAPYPWILHPVIDMLMVCGGFMWMGIIGYYLVGAQLNVTTALALSVLCNVLTTDTHQPATLVRVYGSSRTRKHVGNIVTVWGVVVLALAAAGLFSTAVTQVMLIVTLAWASQHLLAQVYGIVLIYCYKRKYIMNEREKQSLVFVINSSIAFYIIRLFSHPETGVPTYYGFKAAFLGQLPSVCLTVATLALQISTVWFAFMIVRKWKREGKVFPVPAILTLCTALMIPSLSTPIFSIFIQNLFHSSQYNVVTAAYFLKEKGLPEGVGFSKIYTQLLSKPALRYFGFLLFLGLTLSVAVPVTLQLIGFAATAGTVCYCALNMHHYFADAVVWKLRDPEVRKILVS